MSAPDDPQQAAAFAVRDCALIAIATGRRAYTLRELVGFLGDCGTDSLYHHVWGGLLEPRFEEPEYHNDFAVWARRGLLDRVLAERLGAVDPTACDSLEALRREFIDILEERLDESERLHWVAASLPFELLQSQLVVFDTGLSAASVPELGDLIPRLSPGSVFYHFIDARRRLPDGGNDFSVFLARCGPRFDVLRAELDAVDPYFGSLTELRDVLGRLFAEQAPEGAQ